MKSEQETLRAISTLMKATEHAMAENAAGSGNTQTGTLVGISAGLLWVLDRDPTPLDQILEILRSAKAAHAELN